MKTKVLIRRQSKYLVPLGELRRSLPDGLRRVLDQKGIPVEGSGKYSIPNERLRISQRKEG